MMMMIMLVAHGRRECYYPSVRTENKGLLALFCVRQGRWVD